jgi:hypothetical protein
MQTDHYVSSYPIHNATYIEYNEKVEYCVLYKEKKKGGIEQIESNSRTAFCLPLLYAFTSTICNKNSN